MSTPSVVLFTPPTSQQECNTRDTAVVGLSITLALAFIFIMGLGGILIFVIWKKTSASSQGGFSHKGFELKEPRENERD
ncbi:hypothetical protein GBAR_LOCUS19998 [Geodia barretti]|nr:hypothetical protein GBAR_LOCUS19998 [Geodia barretti]